MEMGIAMIMETIMTVTIIVTVIKQVAEEKRSRRSETAL